MKKLLPVSILIILIAAIGTYIYKNPSVLKSKPKEAAVQGPVISAQLANTSLFITNEGQITDTPANNLPQLFLSFEATPQAGTKITNTTELFAVKIASLITKTDFRASSIRIVEGADVAVYDTKQTIAIFSSKKSPEQQVDSLQQVIGKARIGDDKIAKIDLRYENPVISTK